MKTLIDIATEIKPGDIVLQQRILSDDEKFKPELVIIVGIDIWDQAFVVYYTRYKEFDIAVENGEIVSENPKVYSFAEWGECWMILGHWRSMPKFKNLLKAYRKSINNQHH